jgi:hypothetical protein
LAVVPALSVDAVPASAGQTGAAGYPAIGSVVISRPLPSYAAAPPGPDNGPLTASAFAAQSADPQQAEASFTQLAAEPGFAAFVRLWTDPRHAGIAANDVVVTLYRIPDPAAAATFADGVRHPYQGIGASSPFDIPSIPGGSGYTVHVVSPTAATEQVVVFRTGAYVAIVQLASSDLPGNPSPLTRADAIDVAFEQYSAIEAIAGAAEGAIPTRGSGGGISAVWSVVLVVVVVVLVAAGVVIAANERRRRHRNPLGLNPWATDGVLAAMGAVLPPPPRHGDRPPRPVAELDRGPAVVVPAARSGPPADPLVEPPTGTPASWLPDPSGAAGTLRFWDGSSWTGHRAEPITAP